MPWIPGQASLEDRESRFPSCDAVPTVRCEDLSPKAFRAEFMAKNLPVMITGLTDDWRARREWVTKDGQPDVVAMSELFGDAKVLVVDCDEEIDTDLKRREMPFREFARWWRSSATGKRASAGAAAPPPPPSLPPLPASPPPSTLLSASLASLSTCRRCCWRRQTFRGLGLLSGSCVSRDLRSFLFGGASE